MATSNCYDLVARTLRVTPKLAKLEYYAARLPGKLTQFRDISQFLVGQSKFAIVDKLEACYIHPRFLQ
jgi:hypothetical protein